MLPKKPRVPPDFASWIDNRKDSRYVLNDSRGAAMTRQSSIGLRHIVEGTIKILEGASVDQNRQQYILTAIRRLLDQAEQGSHFVRERAWVIPPSGRDALDSYSFVDTCLRGSENLDESVRVAKETIEALEGKRSLAPAKRAAAIRLLQDLLEGMRNRRLAYSEDDWDKRIAAIES